MRGLPREHRTRSLLGAYSAELGHLVSRRRAERAAVAAVSEAVVARRTSVQQLANAAQALRKPTDTIVAYCDLMRSHAGKTPEHSLYLEHIARSAKQLREILDGLTKGRP